MRKEILEAFYFRYSCKKFDKTKKIPKNDFDLILEAGRLSPSSFGMEPWKFLVLQKESIREKLKEFAWGGRASLDGASHFVITLVRKKEDTIYNSEYIAQIMKNVQKLPDNIIETKAKFFENFQKNDFNLLQNKESLHDWAGKQAYITLANMLSTAALLKIDSCAIEGFNIIEVEKILEEEGILDTKHFGVCVMAGFGYRDEEPKHEKTRQSASDVIEWIE